MRELVELERQWMAGNRFAPCQALFVLNRAKKVPDWIIEWLVPELQAKLQEEMKKRDTRRYRQRQQDQNIYQSVLTFRHNGMTWEEAYEKAVETAGVYDGTVLNRDRVKNAYVRVRRQQKAGKLV